MHHPITLVLSYRSHVVLGFASAGNALYGRSQEFIGYLFVLRENRQPCVDPPKSKWHDGQRRLSFGNVYWRRVRALDETSIIVCVEQINI